MRAVADSKLTWRKRRSGWKAATVTAAMPAAGKMRVLGLVYQGIVACGVVERKMV